MREVWTLILTISWDFDPKLFCFKSSLPTHVPTHFISLSKPLKTTPTSLSFTAKTAFQSKL